LQNGDVGVRSVQTLTLSTTWTGANFNLVAFRFVYLANNSIYNNSTDEDAVNLGLPQLWNGTTLQQLGASFGIATGNSAVGGPWNVSFTQG
jgi:hypothetical protein